MSDRTWDEMSTEEQEHIKTAEQEKFARMQPIAASANFIHADTAAAARKLAITYWKKNYPNGITIDTIIGCVDIDARSIKTSLFHGLVQGKLDAIPTLKEGMKRASYMGMLQDFDGRGNKNHYFLYKADFDGEENLIFCRVKENFGRNRLYIHEVIPTTQFVYAPQKSDTLQSQPAGKSHLQLRGIALYKYIIADFLQGVNGGFYPDQKEEKTMPNPKAAQKLPNVAEELFSDNELSAGEMEEYHQWLEEEQRNADLYHREIVNSLTYAEESLDDEAAQDLWNRADALHTGMKHVEEAEQSCGSDQETWDGYVPRHENIIRTIERAGDVKSEGQSAEECSKALLGAQESMREGIAYMQERYERILQREKEYQQQLEGLRKRIAELEHEREPKVRSPEEFARCIAASKEFLAAVDAMRQEAKSQPRIIASELLAASRDAVKEAYYAIKLAPTKIKSYLTQKAHKAVDGVLHSIAGVFDNGIAVLTKRRNAILEKSHEIQSATEFYRDVVQKEIAGGKGQRTMDTEIYAARSMAQAGFGVYVIEKTLRAESPFRKKMEEGAAKSIAEDSVRAREEEQTQEKTR